MRLALALCIALVLAVPACASLVAPAFGDFTLVSEPRAGDMYTDPATGMEFVWVPTGCFQMGSPASEKDRDEDEGPVHEVCVDGFWMGRYEVTNAQYRQFDPGHSSKEFEGESLDGDTQPAVFVSWHAATEYALLLSFEGQGTYRLPTEAEWEYAARAGTTTSRFWGDSPSQACGYANVADRAAKDYWNPSDIHDCDDGYAVSAPVGSFLPNAFGLYDMLGNVWEWSQDWHAEDAYSRHPRNNPVYLAGGTDRVRRGGSWYNGPKSVRCAYRDWFSPCGYQDDNIGFRLVREP